LEYKSLWKSKKVISVNTYYPSSQICSHCGEREKEIDILEQISTEATVGVKVLEWNHEKKRKFARIPSENLKKFKFLLLFYINKIGFDNYSF